MSLTKQIEIVPLTCIYPAQGIEICPIDTAGVTEFHMPSSHETLVVHIAPGIVEALMVHHFQTDQLFVVKGSAILVVLLDRTYQYIVMREDDPKIVRIPWGVPHGAINLSSEPCVAINSVIRHGATHERDFRPIKYRIPYDLQAAQALLAA
ncbi:MAG TPA: cupin domain-containing protein [Allocoleopsis sp.]